MYTLKSTEGEEILKTDVKLTHPKKNPSQKPPNCSNNNFSHHFRGILKKSQASNLLDCLLPLLFLCDQINTLI